MLLELFNLPEKKGQPGDDAPRGRRLGDKKYVPRKTVDFVKYNKRDHYEFKISHLLILKKLSLRKLRPKKFGIYIKTSGCAGVKGHLKDLGT